MPLNILMERGLPLERIQALDSLRPEAAEFTFDIYMYLCICIVSKRIPSIIDTNSGDKKSRLHRVGSYTTSKRIECPTALIGFHYGKAAKIRSKERQLN